MVNNARCLRYFKLEPRKQEPYPAEKILEFMGVQLLHFTKLLCRCLPSDCSGTSVQQQKKSLESTAKQDKDLSDKAFFPHLWNSKLILPCSH